MEETPSLTVRKAAKALGVTPRTLKYYEEQGLVTPSRSNGRYRLYDAQDLERFARILRLKSLGFSLHTIAELIRRPYDSTTETDPRRYSESSLREIHAALQQKLQSLDARIEQMLREFSEVRKIRQELRDDLDYMESRLAGMDKDKLLAARAEHARKRACGHEDESASSGKKRTGRK